MVERSSKEGRPKDKTPSWSRWSRERAARTERTEETVTPIIYPPENTPNPDVHVWDTWLMRDRHGQVAEVDGWRVAFSLTAPADLLPGKRHDVARIRCFASRDGYEWLSAGPVFDGDALGQRQWAGSALYDDGDVYLYYTAAGEAGADELRYTQRIAGAAGGTITATEREFGIEGPWTHEILLTPDGEWYETDSQSRGMIYTFRDPWFYEDPTTGETTLLFEANTPVPEGSDLCDGDPERQTFTGCIGISVSTSGDPMSWDLRPPILDGVCVNQELERPHVVRWNGRYYLFTSSHKHTFAPGLSGYDGLYGFVADSLGGPYRPLNDSGLVLTNPSNAPFQAYSWIVFPHDEELLVEQFFNYYAYEGDSMDGIGDLPEAEQRRRFGGTLGPTVRLETENDRTRILGTLDHWHIPLPGESLPDPMPNKRGGNIADDRTGDYHDGNV